MSLFYEDEFVTLYHDDCREVPEWLAADALVTDPPYGISWSRGEWNNAKNSRPNSGIRNDHDTTVRDAALSTWGDDKPGLVFGSLQAEYPPGWKRMLVFGKPDGAGLIGSRMPWFRNWEPIFVMGNWPEQTPTKTAVVRTSEIAHAGYSGYATRAGHPHAKPQDVMTRLLEACDPSWTIADPFAGSGSTLLAARNLGRKVIGVELEERYCELIVKRLAQQAFNFEDLETA